jgi:hypothetical protein
MNRLGFGFYAKRARRLAYGIRMLLPVFYWFWMAWSRCKIRLVRKRDGYESLPLRHFCANSLPSIRG